jgi:hypothetical protein
MRTILAAALALIAGTMSVSAQAADPYRWCALYFGDGLGGTTTCYFVTQEQCLATVSGVGGYCMPNPRNPLPQAPLRPAPRTR